MENTTHRYYEELYLQISGVLIWIELLPIPFTIACSVSWIIIAVFLLRKRDCANSDAFHLKSLRVHYLTALHRQRLIQSVILLIAINCILTDVTLTIRTSYQVYHIVTQHNNYTNNTYHLEYGQWSNYRLYGWLYIAWFAPMMVFSQSYYWSVALLPITTRAYFNVYTGFKHFKLVLIFIITRGTLMAVLWLIPYTIPLGVVMVVLTLGFDWMLIMYCFISAYKVAKNKTKALLEGLDEKDAIDSEFISKLRFLYLIFCLILSLILASMLQAILIEYVLPMVVYPNYWLEALYNTTIQNKNYSKFGETYNSTFSLVQVVSRLELRVVITLCRVVYLVLSGISFVFILRFRLKQDIGKKLKKKRVLKESTPLVND